MMRVSCLLFLVAFSAFGQGNTSSIVGTVTDPSAAVIAGVKVVATNAGTGVQSPGTTDSLGNYTINLLPPGISEIRIVNIEGLDLQADGGTHVANTREVGHVKVVGYESKGKINKRIRIQVE